MSELVDLLWAWTEERACDKLYRYIVSNPNVLDSTQCMVYRG